MDFPVSIILEIICMILNTQKEYIDNTLPDGTLDPAWWTPYRQRQVYDYREIPDHTLYASFGGPLDDFRANTSKIFYFITIQTTGIFFTASTINEKYGKSICQYFN